VAVELQLLGGEGVGNASDLIPHPVIPDIPDGLVIRVAAAGPATNISGVPRSRLPLRPVGVRSCAAAALSAAGTVENPPGLWANMPNPGHAH